MLAARRGLGVEEERLATPEFLAAIRWATYAERIAPEFVEARQVANTDPPKELTNAGGPELIAFRARRENARAIVAELDPALFPPDEPEASDGG